MMNRLYTLIAAVVCAITTVAQTISVNCPQHVGVGEQFKLMYTIPTQDVKGFRGGNVPDGLDVLMGPSMSSQSSFQMINGHTSSSSSITYTYIICADKAGTYTIGAAHATVGGKAAASSSVKIKVSGQAQGNSGGGSNGGSRMQQDPGAQVRQAGARISGNDLFIRVTANKKRVHEQEPVLLTYKVYTQVELTQLEGKMPDLKGFHTQEIPLPQQKSFHLENVNGRPYRCVTWSQYVMYPQMTGKLEIPPITFKGIVVQENRNVDPFEAFFNGGSGYVEVKKDIVAPSVTIQVDALPDRPANFSGGVGRFSVSSSLNKTTVAANDPVTLRLVVSGNGNLKLLKQPVVEFPKDFDKYDPKSTDKTKLTANGLEGSMIYDYLFVPRNQGDYTIPAVEFTYYDTGSNAYKTVKTQPQTIHVTPGEGKANAVADFADDDQDIRGLNLTGNATTADDIIFGTTTYKTLIAVILLAFIALIWIFRKRAIERADIVGMKGKKANKVATKRLKRAAKLMAQHKEADFYDEVLRALWGYVGDKLNIPVSELSRENITERLLDHNVDNGSITVFVDAIDECEYARFAPGEALGKMSTVYEKAMNAITDIDNFLSGKKQKGAKADGSVHSNATTTVLAIMLMLTATATNVAAAPAEAKAAEVETKAAEAEAKAAEAEAKAAEAEAAYSKGNYQQAVKIYSDLVKATPSAENYYNLGNALYRSDDLTQAIIAYNRAARLDPSNADIRHNLQVARTKTIDKMQPNAETFIVAWWNDLVNSCSINTWAIISIAALIMLVLLTLVYLFMDAVILRQIGFFGAIIALVVFLLGNLCAYSQHTTMTADDGAVVIATDCPVKKSPEVKAQDEAVIHEGTHMRITDTTIQGWLEVTLDDGTEGWIESRNVELITKE